MFSIYKCTCSINNKSYIGITENFEIRKNGHLTTAFKNDSKRIFIFHKAIQKYGIDSFYWNILYQLEDKEFALEMEKYCIYVYNTFYKNNQGYNMTLGGEGCNGHKHSIKTRKILSEKRKLRPPMSEETKQKISLSNKGKKLWSPEQKLEISKRMKGRKGPRLGHKNSEEHNEKISKANKGNTAFLGRKHSEETKQKMSLSKKGKKQSPEHIAKLSKIRKEKRGKSREIKELHDGIC